MKAKKPTDAQSKEFWDECGVKPTKHYEQTHLYHRDFYWEYPIVDLNNLFKYALLKLEEEIGWRKTKKLLKSWISSLYGAEEEDAYRLFRAIWEVIHERDN